MFNRAARRRVILPGLALMLVFLVGCVPVRQGVSWADLMLIDDQYVLVSYNNFMVMLDPSNGVPAQLRDAEGQVRLDDRNAPLRWELTGADGSQFFASPVAAGADDNVRFVADYNYRLIAVNFNERCFANTLGACVDTPVGLELGGHVIADMAFDGERLFIPYSEHNLDEHLVAVDVDSLQVAWSLAAERGIWSAPLLVEDMLYVASMDHRLYALDAVSGEQRWSFDAGGALAATPLYIPASGDDEARLYTGTFSREVVAVSADGQERARYDTAGWVWSSPVLFDGLLYVTDLNGYVYALNPSDLSEVWKQNLGDSGGFRASPIVTDQFVVVAGRSGRVYWLVRESGAESFQHDLDAEILSDMLLVNRSDETLIVISTTSGRRVAVAYTIDGAPRWTYGR